MAKADGENSCRDRNIGILKKTGNSGKEEKFLQGSHFLTRKTMPDSTIPVAMTGMAGSAAAFLVFETDGFQEDVATGRVSAVPETSVSATVGTGVGRVSPGFKTRINAARAFVVLPASLAAVRMTV